MGLWAGVLWVGMAGSRVGRMGIRLGYIRLRCCGSWGRRRGDEESCAGGCCCGLVWRGDGSFWGPWVEGFADGEGDVAGLADGGFLSSFAWGGDCSDGRAGAGWCVLDVARGCGFVFGATLFTGSDRASLDGWGDSGGRCSIGFGVAMAGCGWWCECQEVGGALQRGAGGCWMGKCLGVLRHEAGFLLAGPWGRLFAGRGHGRAGRMAILSCGAAAPPVGVVIFVFSR